MNRHVPVPNENDVGFVGFEAREVISRLEDAVERAADGGGMAWDNHLGFLTQPKSPETVLQLIQVVN